MAKSPLPLKEIFATSSLLQSVYSDLAAQIPGGGGMRIVSTSLIRNDTDADIYLSFNGLDDHEFIFAQEALAMDSQQDKGIWVRYASLPPTSGAVRISAKARG
jgi:hypothetical protein